MAVGAIVLLVIGATLAFAAPLGLPMFYLPVAGTIFMIAGALLLVVWLATFRRRRAAMADPKAKGDRDTLIGAVTFFVLQILLSLVALLVGVFNGMTSCSSDYCNFPLGESAGWILVISLPLAFVVTVIAASSLRSRARPYLWVPIVGCGIVLLIVAVNILLVAIAFHTVLANPI
jgi:hypothetical protein